MTDHDWDQLTLTIEVYISVRCLLGEIALGVCSMTREEQLEAISEYERKLEKRLYSGPVVV
jgi:hypothetical protein